MGVTGEKCSGRWYRLNEKAKIIIKLRQQAKCDDIENLFVNEAGNTSDEIVSITQHLVNTLA